MLNGIVSRRKREIAIASEPVKYLRTRKPPAYSGNEQSSSQPMKLKSRQNSRHLLVIPGIVKTYSYAMTPYIMSEHPSLTANEAITESRRIMDGNKWRLFCLDFSFIGWELLCSLPLYAGGFLVLKYFTGS